MNWNNRLLTIFDFSLLWNPNSSLNNNVNRLVKTLVIILFVLSLFFIPQFYKERLITRVFKTDFYLIWIIGCLCLLYNSFFVLTKLNQTGITILLSCSYIFLLCVSKSFPDENSLYAFITFICCINIVCFLQFVVTSKYCHFIFISILICYFFQLEIGFAQLIRNGGRALSIRGQLNNSGIFANYISSILPLLFSAFVSKKMFNRPLRFVFLLALLSGLFLLTFTLSRSALVGCILGCLFVVASRFKKKFNQKEWIAIALVSIIVFSISFFFMYKLKPASALGRLVIYEISTEIISDNPLTGIGANRFSAVYNNYQANYFRYETVPVSIQLLANNIFEAYNSIFQVLIEYGFIGFIFLAFFVFQIMKSASISMQNQNVIWLWRGSVGSIISIIASSFFSNPFHVTPIILFFLYHISIITSQSNRSIPRKNKPALILSISISLLVFYYAFTQHTAESKWYKASNFAKYGEYEKAKKLYNETYPYLKFNGDFLYNYGAEASLANDYFLSIYLLERAKKFNSFSNIFLFLGNSYANTKQFNLAEKNYLHSIFMVPSHVYPKYQLIKMYKQWGKEAEAKQWTRKTLEFPIKIRSNYIDHLLNELNSYN